MLIGEEKGTETIQQKQSHFKENVFLNLYFVYDVILLYIKSDMNRSEFFRTVKNNVYFVMFS